MIGKQNYRSFASNEENCDNVFNEHILLFLNTEHWQLNDKANPPFDKKNLVKTNQVKLVSRVTTSTVDVFYLKFT